MHKLINELEGVLRWPKKPSEKHLVIKWLSKKFKFDKKYSEKEINKILKQYHSFNDIALLRRELVSRKYLQRKIDGSQYWKIN